METTADSRTPDDIDLGFVPHLVSELEIAAIGDEQVVLGGSTQLVVLNPTAALIFGFLDGEATLGELVDDFSDALGVDRATVESDVLSFVRDLGASGLLEGVAPPVPEIPHGMPDDWAPPEKIEVGAELDDFTLTDLDDNERSLSEFRGRRTLLVNWSPACGFCVVIASELAALHPVLLEHDVELVLLAQGDADTNRALHEEHGLAAPTLLRGDSDVDPFHGTGTPAAYVLEADGTLAEAMAVGAAQVPVVARDLAGVDPATPYSASDAEGDELDRFDDELGDEVRGAYLPAPGAMCGPGGGSGANSTNWSGKRVYSLGGYHVGLQYDDDATAEVLDRFFPGARVNDRRTPDNYAIALGGTASTKGARASRSLKLLVQGGTQIVRSRSGARVMAALLQYVSADLEPDTAGLVRVNATAVVHGEQALLLPPGLNNFIKVLQPRLAKAGMTMVDTPRTYVDFEARELVVPDPVVPFDASVLDELDADVKLGNELPWVRPGRYPLRAWFLARSPAHVGALTSGVAVTAAVPLLYDLDDLRNEVERLGGLFDDVAAQGTWYDSANQLVDQVSAAL
jgi:peroxiredoxin